MAPATVTLAMTLRRRLASCLLESRATVLASDLLSTALIVRLPSDAIEKWTVRNRMPPVPVLCVASISLAESVPSQRGACRVVQRTRTRTLPSEPITAFPKVSAVLIVVSGWANEGAGPSPPGPAEPPKGGVTGGGGGGGGGGGSMVLSGPAVLPGRPHPRWR